jgi:hypothetical protein
MDPELPGPKINCNANYGLTLFSERVSHFRIKTFSEKKKKKKRNNLAMGPIVGPDTNKDQLTDCRP